MSRSIYSVSLPFDTFRFSADLSEPSAAICLVNDIDGEDETQSTPYQTSTARHDVRRAAELALAYCGRDYYAQPGDERDDDEIIADLLDGEEIVCAELEPEEPSCGDSWCPHCGRSDGEHDAGYSCGVSS